ncbi:hypothetical protein J2T09_003813 [Neorhizobium huautlense]|uniref:Uncharacterized protein n=1 Tax=Neorhizobium huautlense TaxID=67774 RepID=A0ABT9PX35_9HYPH|nr:hypothetical protein [Neorhizobium huautlense]MDP9839038.1 hypothetical protein [Neorhizobium huautlense]
MALACAVAFSSVPVRAEEGAIDPAAAETCVAVFTVMAYAYADDDLKERLLEEKKVLARAHIRPQQDVVSAQVQASEVQAPDVPSSEAQIPQSLSSEDRIQHIMDVLTEMMLSEPVKAQGIAKECFRQYPPEIELN